MTKWLGVAVVVWGLGFARPARACPGAGAAARADELARKKEGVYVTGLPFVSYDSNDGWGGGGRVYVYDNGARGTAAFRDAPYRYRLYLQAFAVQSGSQRHALDLDVPCAFGGVRLRAHAYFTRSDNENHFGAGAAAMGPLSHPGTAETFSTFAAYRQSARGLYPGGVTYANYSKYGLTQPGMLLTAQLPRGPLGLIPLVGVELRHTAVHDFTGEEVAARADDGAATKAPSAPTRLREDCLAGRATGCSGGFESVWRLGLSYDTRDYEPNPTRGVLVDAVVDLASSAVGGGHTHVKALLAPHVFVPVGPGGWRLVAVGRAAGQIASAGTPFYTLSEMPFSGGPRSGLGGLTSLRGYRQDRFVGQVATMANAELRWTFTRGTLWRQDLAVMLAPTFDTGRVYDRAADLTFRGWRWNAGGAVRVAWNQATIIALDAAWSAEDAGVYLNFGHPL